MTVETMNPARRVTGGGAREALLCCEPFDPITTVPIEHPAVARQRFRAKLARVIDRLIVALDDIDGDPDLEPGGDDEPSLGAPVPYAVVSQDAWSQGSGDDREADDSDREPSLSGVGFSTAGGQDDREDQCEDEGFDGERESEDGL